MGSLLVIIFLSVLWVPAVRWFMPGLPSGSTLACAFLLGSGFETLWLLLLSTAGIPWTRTLAAALPVLTGMVGAFYLIRSYRDRDAVPDNRSSEPQSRTIALVAEALLAFSLLGYAVYATIAPPWLWDFWSIWGLKGVVFFRAHAVDWKFLLDGDHAFAHPAYPPLLPLLYSFLAIITDRWDERWFQLLYPFFALSIVLVVRDQLSESTSRTLAGVGALAAAGSACSAYVGLADGPLTAFAVTGLLLMRAAIRTDDRRMLVVASTLLGFAAFTKEEGYAIVLAAAVALAICSRWDFLKSPRFWIPAIGPAGVWMVLRNLHGLSVELGRGAVLARIGSRLSNSGPILVAIISRGAEKKGLILVFLVALAFAGRSFVRKERFLLAATTLQVAAYAAAFWIGLDDPFWRIHTTWTRITGHSTVTLGFLAFLALLSFRDQSGETKTAMPISSDSSLELESSEAV